MLLQRSKLAATPVERPRLAPPWSIGLLGTLVAVVLTAIFPHQTLVKRVLDAPPGDITDAYLANLLRTEPDNPHLRLAMARKQLLAGQYERIAPTIAPALASADPAVRQQAAWLRWQADEQRFFRRPDDDPERPAARRALLDALQALADDPLPELLLAEFARKAAALGDTALARRLFARLVEEGGAHSEAWYAEAARSALAEGEYGAAANYYLIALQRVAGLAEQRRYLALAMQALVSGNRTGEALELAERAFEVAPALTDDRETLITLIEYARAARRPDLADRYARRLLRLSLREQFERSRLVYGELIEVRRVALGDGPQLPFDDRIYTLGFEAFLDNRKPEDAWKVAASAVRQAPDSLVWRERLARVSEWTGRSQLALEHWLHIARTSDREEAWQNVLRLAPGLFDDDALRLALRRELTRRPGDERLLRELAAIHERLGDPRGAIVLLESEHRRRPRPWLLEEMASLAERAGDAAQAIEGWRRFIDSGAAQTAHVVRLATLLVLRGDDAGALAVLRPHEATAAPGDTAYWRLTAELARQLEADATATRAYRTLLAGDSAEERDYDALHALLQPQHPLDAARVAIAAWRRYHRPLDLQRALSGLIGADAWEEAGRLLGDLDAAQLARLRQDALLLRLTARYHQHRGVLAAARRDLDAALALAPNDAETRTAWLWLLIDSGDAQALRRALATLEPDWRQDPQLHDVLGTAYQYLSRPDVALKRYFNPHLAEKRGDFLWLMNYADALEQNSEPDKAWRLRRHLLAGERPAARPRDWLSAPEARGMRRIARARLAIAQAQGGDIGRAVLRELLRLDRDAERRLSDEAATVATAWLQEQQAYAAERGWLWQQFARSVARPLWGEITLALVDDDRAASGALLERHGERLPRYDRINAARHIDDVRLAQSDAFETQGDQPDDDPLHLQLTDALLAHSDHAGGERLQRRIGSIEERETALRWHLALSPRLALDLALGSIARGNGDPLALGSVPDESFRSARLTWRHGDGETRLGIDWRDSFAAYQPHFVEHEQRIDERLALTFGIGRQLPAADSTPLRVAGMKDRFSLSLRYRPTLRDQLVAEYSHEDFRTQTGSDVGSARQFAVEYRHALRLEPRDLELSLYWSTRRHQRVETIEDAALAPLAPLDAEDPGRFAGSFFLPEDYRFASIRLSTDVRFAGDYTRAWRPYATVARTWNSLLGPGYDLGAGIAGSVFGADHLRIGWNLARGGRTGGGSVRELGIAYRIHY